MRFERASMPPIDRRQFIGELKANGVSKAEAQRQYARLLNDEVWLSVSHQVNVEKVNSPLGEITHLSIKRRDKAPIRDWRELQAIKNALCGPEREACELYPAESRLVDAANQYHLWVLPEGLTFPFGFFGGRAVENDSKFGAVQRPMTIIDEASDVPPAVWETHAPRDNPVPRGVVRPHRPLTVGMVAAAAALLNSKPEGG